MAPVMDLPAAFATGDARRVLGFDFPKSLGPMAMAGGRAFHVRRPGGTEAIRYRFPDGGVLDVPVFPGLADGKWAIARRQAAVFQS